MTPFRLTLLIGTATSLTRILGFLRDVLLAALFGAGPVADAFFVALRVPNLVRRLMGEGGWSSAYVPIATKLIDADDTAREASLIRDSLFYVSMLAAVFVIIGEIWTTDVLTILAPGLSQDRYDLAVLYFRALLPLIFGATLTSLLSAILISKKKFILQALVPVSVNVVLVLLLVYFNNQISPDYAKVGLILSWAASAATFVQVFVLIIPVYFRFDKLIFKRPTIGPDFRAMAALALPGFVIQFGVQFGILILLNNASQTPGAISYLTYAERLAQLPFGFIASSLATIALPEFASRVIMTNSDALHRSIDRVIFLSIALALPAAIALVILAEPIVSVLFERGAFSSADRIGTAAALAGFAFGLPFASLARVQMQLYFAYERVRIPLLSTIISSILIGLLVQMSIFSQSPFGFAFAFSIGQGTVWALQQIGMRRLSGWMPEREFRVKIYKVVFATGLLALALLIANYALTSFLISDQATFLRWACLAGLCVGGLGLYALMMHFLGLLKEFR
jgi:putative peptidoglycan lipid II flippase